MTSKNRHQVTQRNSEISGQPKKYNKNVHNSIDTTNITTIIIKSRIAISIKADTVRSSASLNLYTFFCFLCVPIKLFDRRCTAILDFLEFFSSLSFSLLNFFLLQLTQFCLSFRQIFSFLRLNTTAQRTNVYFGVNKEGGAHSSVNCVHITIMESRESPWFFFPLRRRGGAGSWIKGEKKKRELRSK